MSETSRIIVKIQSLWLLPVLDDIFPFFTGAGDRPKIVDFGGRGGPDGQKRLPTNGPRSGQPVGGAAWTREGDDFQSAPGSLINGKVSVNRRTRASGQHALATATQTSSDNSLILLTFSLIPPSPLGELGERRDDRRKPIENPSKSK